MIGRIQADGIVDLGDFIRTAPDVAKQAASLAINTVAKGTGFTRIKRAIEDEIAFPSGYLSGDRLSVGQTAKPNNLMAVIVGRKVATSLARFASSTDFPGSKSQGVTVRVQKGKSTYLKNAFLVKLKRGASIEEDNYNIGLAVRLGPGEEIQNKRIKRMSWLVKGKVALLYGPSVDQVFATVADDLAQPLADMTSDEFFRQFARLTNG